VTRVDDLPPTADLSSHRISVVVKNLLRKMLLLSIVEVKKSSQTPNTKILVD
jgi:hypothetical protein